MATDKGLLHPLVIDRLAIIQVGVGQAHIEDPGLSLFALERGISGVAEINLSFLCREGMHTDKDVVSFFDGTNIVLDGRVPHFYPFFL